jgi:hypothetical protein
MMKSVWSHLKVGKIYLTRRFSKQKLCRLIYIGMLYYWDKNPNFKQLKQKTCTCKWEFLWSKTCLFIMFRSLLWFKEMITKPSRIVIKTQCFDSLVTRLRIRTGSFLTVSDIERDDQTLDIYPSVHFLSPLSNSCSNNLQTFGATQFSVFYSL